MTQHDFYDAARVVIMAVTILAMIAVMLPLTLRLIREVFSSHGDRN